ncbi:MAG: inhibitor of cysteine peptidase [Acidobacteriota bacterium]|jgi:protocatechuate 3,4-dioxygenase beta subunit|nr:inhibitor of cysteine peptidase [Acidobacteriota bacterium]
MTTTSLPIRRPFNTLIPVLASVLVLVIASAVSAQTRTPVLVSDSGSTRAIALESPTKTSEPFHLTSPLAWGADRRTRVMLFAMNLDPAANESAVIAEAEDAAHARHALIVEYVGQMAEVDGLSRIIVVLDDSLPADAGDVLVGITVYGAKSNRVRIGIGHIGGGLADDAGASPTPLPPYTISGRVTSEGVAFGGVLIKLGGNEQRTVTTDANGLYAFTLNSVGDYTITPSKNFYTFSPAGKTFSPLSGNRTVNFEATQMRFAIRGKIKDDTGQFLSGVPVTLNSATTVVTDSAGGYSFTGLPNGNYTITVSKPNYSFTPPSQTFNNLSSDQVADFNARSLITTISGTITVGDTALGNVQVLLTGSQTATATTSESGKYSFANLPRNGHYTITPSKPGYTFNPLARSFILALPTETANFVATLDTYSISGSMTEGTTGIADVTVNLGGSANLTTRTDANGDFTFTKLPAGGNYIITPGSGVFNFTPQTISTLISNQQLSFKGTRKSYDITGRVSDGTAGVGNVTVNLTGSASLTMRTDANGDFSFTKLLAGGNYIIAPSSTDTLNFAPQMVSTLGSSQQLTFQGTRKNNAATGYVLIKGQVFDEAHNPLAGVTVSIDTGSQVTDAQGRYSFPNLAADKTYTVSATGTNVYDFVPQKPVVLDTALQLDFQGARKTYIVSGQVMGDGQGVPGATVSLTGGRTQLTDAVGNFSIAVPAGFDYVVQVTSPLFAFSPVTLNSVASNQTINLTGTLRSYTIRGHVTEGSTPMAHIVLLVSSTDGQVSGVAETDGNGLYSFPNLPAGLSYVITAAYNPLYTFTGATTQQRIGSDRTVDLTGTRRIYSISGKIVDQLSAPLDAATVTLYSAASNSSVTTLTDAAGTYSFPDLRSGIYYQVSAAKVKYLFTSGSKQFDYLSADGRADFAADLTYDITGRVTDTSGQPLLGVTLSLAGPQTRQTLTNANGAYVFTVSVPGNYLLTPSKEQNLYNFSPSSQSLNVTSDLTSNFTVAYAAPSHFTHVLEFDGAPFTVSYGPFWPEWVNLGHFFWEFWAMPGANAYTRYLLSDGYGGAHALLFGFSTGDDASRYSLNGNIFTGTDVVYFQSSEGPAPGEWGHFAVGWDGHNIITYYDGVPVGKDAFAGPRISPGQAWGAGNLYIGGSDHNNLIGRIAQVRGFEESNPREGAPEASFAPQSLFSTDGNLLSYFSPPAARVADLSSGYNGTARSGQLLGGGSSRFVVDPTAPNFTDANNPGQVSAPVDAPPSPPAGSLVYDSFSRKNSTYILGGIGGLGATEGGSRGSLTWKTNEADVTKRQPFGILNGHGVLLADATSIAWVNAGASDVSVQSSRTRGTGGAGHNTGLAFRVADARNYFFAYTGGDDGNTLNVGYYIAGSRVKLATDLAMTEGWYNLEVVTSAKGVVQVYADGALIYSTTNTVMSQNTGAGIYSDGTGMALTNRWDNFTVLTAP